MRKVLSVSAFLIMMALCGILILLPADTDSVLMENREPAAMPDASLGNIFFGDFCQDFESYLSDNVGYRGELIGISNKFSGLKGMDSYGKIINANADLGTGDTSNEKLLLLTDDRVMEVFAEKPESREKYIGMVNHYASKLPGDIRLYSMVIPTQIEFADEKYEGLSDSQLETINAIYSGVDKRVTAVDVYSVLEEHKEEYIYFRTDHHWTTLGAYYAYEQFAAAAGLDSADISEFEEKGAEGFLGFLYNQAQATSLENQPDTIYYYSKGEPLFFEAKAWENGGVVGYKGKTLVLPGTGEAPKYTIFMNGDHPLLDMQTGIENGRIVLVVKDSYANAFMPWLAHSFERIVAVDPRSFGGDISEVIAEYNVTDVLLMNYSFTTTFDDIISREVEIYK